MQGGLCIGSLYNDGVMSMVYAAIGRAEQLHAAGVASMSPYYDTALPSANSVASIIPALTAYATAAMPHLGSMPLPLPLPSASLAEATRQVSHPHLRPTSPCFMGFLSLYRLGHD